MTNFIWATVAFLCLWVAWIWLYKISDSTHILIRKYLFGDKVIVVVGTQYDFQSGPFKTILQVAPITGKKFAYRYTANKIGKVSLNSDGTGDYCGRVLWKEI
jgi:hypothetical protein